MAGLLGGLIAPIMGPVVSGLLGGLAAPQPAPAPAAAPAPAPTAAPADPAPQQDPNDQEQAQGGIDLGGQNLASYSYDKIIVWKSVLLTIWCLIEPEFRRERRVVAAKGAREGGETVAVMWVWMGRESGRMVGTYRSFALLLLGFSLYYEECTVLALEQKRYLSVFSVA